MIEGHDTHPVDIERALNEDYSDDSTQRNLPLEAKAHISVQQWIDAGGLAARATTQEGILEVHRRFCKLLPEDLLWVENPDTKERIRVTRGRYRERDIKVARHVPVSPGAVPRFMDRFESAYVNLGRVDRIVASPCAIIVCCGYTRF